MKHPPGNTTPPSPRSPPVRRRGLKQPRCTRICATLMVASRAEAWIETSATGDLNARRGVSPPVRRCSATFILTLNDTYFCRDYWHNQLSKNGNFLGKVFIRLEVRRSQSRSVLIGGLLGAPFTLVLTTSEGSVRPHNSERESCPSKRMRDGFMLPILIMIHDEEKEALPPFYLSGWWDQQSLYVARRSGFHSSLKCFRQLLKFDQRPGSTKPGCRR